MADRPLQYRSRLSIRERGTPLGTNAFEKAEDSTADSEGFVDAFELTLPSCAGCLAVMHSPEEVGGACGVCRDLVCTRCSDLRCEIDGQIICKRHSLDARGRLACSTHRFLDLIILAFRRAQ
jgi:hypothetical protein